MEVQIQLLAALATNVPGQMTGGGMLKDYGGNLFKSYVMNDRSTGDEDVYIVVAKLTPAGQLSAVQVRVADEWKLEGPTGEICFDGADVVGGLLMHRRVEPRTLMPGFFRIVGMVTPFPEGIDPRSGAGAVSMTFAGGGGEQVNYEQVRAIVQAENDALLERLKSEFGSGNIRQALQDKAKDGVFDAYEIILARPEELPAGLTTKQRRVRDMWWGKFGDRVFSTLRDWWRKRDA